MEKTKNLMWTIERTNWKWTEILRCYGVLSMAFREKRENEGNETDTRGEAGLVLTAPRRLLEVAVRVPNAFCRSI